MKSAHSRFATLAAACALGVLGGAAAQAQSTVFTFDSAGPNSEVVEMVGANGQPFGVYAGRYEGQLGAADGQGAQVNVFCVDYTHEIQNGDHYKTDDANLITASAGAKTSSGYYNGGLASALNSSDFKPTGTMSDSQRASEVAYLADTYLNATASTFASGGQVTFTNDAAGSAGLNNNLTAVSLSIWDIMQDGGNGLASGSVELYDNLGTSTASLYNYSLLDSLSSYYEQQAAQYATYQSSTAYWIQAPVGVNGSHMQDYVYEGTPRTPNGLPAAPEPAGFVPMTAGLGALALMIIARRRKARLA